MFIRTRTIVILALLLIAVLAAEWKSVAFITEAQAIHNYHGVCNTGVGRPYEEFIHQLRTMAESGDTNKLAAVLRRADERSRDIYEAWLDAYNPDAYRKSIQEILK